MKKEIFLNHEALKRILCYSSAHQAIAVTEEMVEYLFQDSNEVILLTATGENLSEIINRITLDDNVKGKRQKVIILVRTTEQYALKVSDLSQISTLIAQFTKESDFCWGMATAKEQANNITLLIAISSK